MSRTNLTSRIAVVEQRMTDWEHRVESTVEAIGEQFTLFRGELRMEFSAFRQMMREESAAFQAGMRTEFADFRDMTQTESAAFQAGMRAEFASFTETMEARDGETRRFMRILHEEVLARIATLGNGRS